MRGDGVSGDLWIRRKCDRCQAEYNAMHTLPTGSLLDFCPKCRGERTAGITGRWGDVEREVTRAPGYAQREYDG